MADSCFDNNYVEKGPVAWKKQFLENWLTLSQTSPDFYVSALQVF